MKPHITINNQPVSWAQIQQLRKRLGGEWDTVIDAFWKAKDKDDVIRYVWGGMKPDNPYSLLPSPERENGRMEELRAWWQGLYKVKGSRQPEAMSKDLLRKAFGL